MYTRYSLIPFLGASIISLPLMSAEHSKTIVIENKTGKKLYIGKRKPNPLEQPLFDTVRNKEQIQYQLDQHEYLSIALTQYELTRLRYEDCLNCVMTFVATSKLIPTGCCSARRVLSVTEKKESQWPNMFSS